MQCLCFSRILPKLDSADLAVCGSKSAQVNVQPRQCTEKYGKERQEPWFMEFLTTCTKYGCFSAVEILATQSILWVWMWHSILFWSFFFFSLPFSVMLFWDSWGRFPAGKLSPHGSTANCTAEVGGSHSALSAWKPREKKPHHHQTIGSRLTLPPLIKLETHHCRNKGETVSRKDIDIAAEKAPAAWAHLVKIMTATDLVTPGKGKTTGADLVGTCPHNVWDGMQISQSPREDTMKKSEWSPHLARHRYTWGGGSKISTHLGVL